MISPSPSENSSPVTGSSPTPCIQMSLLGDLSELKAILIMIVNSSRKQFVEMSKNKYFQQYKYFELKDGKSDKIKYVRFTLDRI